MHSLIDSIRSKWVNWWLLIVKLSMLSGLLVVLTTCAWRFVPPSGRETNAITARIGYLSVTNASSRTVSAFKTGLRELGYVEGTNIAIEWKFADGQPATLAALADDLVNQSVSLIVAGGTPAITAAKHATSSVPIVMAVSANPVEQGFVESLNRPGGNITGLTSISLDLSAKRLEMLRDIWPSTRRVGVLWNGANSAKHLEWEDTRAAALVLGIDIRSLRVDDRKDLDTTLSDLRPGEWDALVVLGDPLMTNNFASINDAANRVKIPTMWETPEAAFEGATAAYGPSRDDLFRRSAYFVDRILKGTPPSELPVERPTRFHLAVNVTTAQAIGRSIDSRVLTFANDVVR